MIDIKGKLGYAVFSIAILLLSGPMLAQNQSITPEPTSQSVLPGNAFSLAVRYNTSPADPTLTGLGLRIHFDSTKLTFQSLTGVLPLGLIAQAAPVPDVANYDGQASTDMFVAIAWADLAGNWPGVLPATLATANFTAKAGFTGTTKIYFSSSSTAAGWGFTSTAATINELIIPPSADLRVTKTNGVTQVTPGQALTYTVEIQNLGPAPVAAATVTDILPMDLEGATWTCTATAGASCTASGSGNISQNVNLAAGSKVTFTLQASLKATASGSLANTASAAVPAGITDPISGNNSATDVDQINGRADLALEMTSTPGAAFQDEDLELLLTVENLGPDKADPFEVITRIPEGLEFMEVTISGVGSCSGSTLLRCRIAGLNEGSELRIRVRTRAGDSNSTTLTATASLLSGGDSNSANNAAHLSFPFVVDKDGDGIHSRVEQNGPFGGDGNQDGILDRDQSHICSFPNVVTGEYLTLEGEPGHQFSGVAALAPPDLETLPEGVTFPLGAFRFELGGLNPGGIANLHLINHSNQVATNAFWKYGDEPLGSGPHWFHFGFDGNTGAQNLGDRLQLRYRDGGRGDGDQSQNGSISDPGAPALVSAGGGLLVSVESNDPVVVGDELTFQVRIRNDNPYSVSGVTFADLFPEVLHFVDMEMTQGSGDFIAPSIGCELGLIPAGAEVLINIQAHAIHSGRIATTVTVDAEQLMPGEEIVAETTFTIFSPLAVPNRLEMLNPLFDKTFVGVAAFNPMSTETEIDFFGLDEFGDPLAVETLADPLPALGQVARLTADFELGDALTMLTLGEPTPLQGFFMVGTGDLRKLDGIGGNLPEESTLFFPYVRELTTERSAFFLFNPVLDQKTIATLTLFSTDGHEVHEVFREIEPRGSLLGTIGDLFGEGLQIHEGYLKVSAGSPLQGYSISGDASTFSSLTGQPAIETRRLIVPHYLVDNEGGNTVIRMLNTGQDEVHVQAEIFGDDASLQSAMDFAIAPRSLFRINLRDYLGGSLAEGDSSGTLSGYVVMTLDSGVDPSGGPLRPAHVVGAVTFEGNFGEFRSTLPLQDHGYRETLLAHVAQDVDLNIFTGLALFNDNEEAVTVVVRAFGADGILRDSISFAMEAGTRVVDLLDGSEFFGPSFSQTGGHLQIISTEQLNVFALFGGFDLKFMSAIEAQELYH